MSGKVYHAWHSKYQRKIAGYCVWEKEDGTRVDATMITDKQDVSCCPNIQDFEYLGTVVRCVEPMRGGMEPLDLDILSSEFRIEQVRERIQAAEKALGYLPKSQPRFDMNAVKWGVEKPKLWSVN